MSRKKAIRNMKHFEIYLKEYGLEGARKIWTERGIPIPVKYREGRS